MFTFQDSQCTKTEVDQFFIALNNHNPAIHKSAVEFSSGSDIAALILKSCLARWDTGVILV